MPVLLLALLVLACESRELGSRVELRGEEAIPATPSPTPTSVDTTCKTSCAACAAWQWGDWSPVTDTVCTGQALTQTRQGTRTCNELCGETKCLLDDTEERERQGTKTCAEPPPPCKTSCVEACGSWDDATWTELTPTPASKCKGLPFTQTQQGIRTCSGLCAEVKCKPKTRREEDAVGTKETPCDEHCTVVWGDWDTKAEDVCKGVSFQKTKQGKRTCTGLCPGTSCPQQASQTQPAVGTKETTCDAGCTWSTWQVVAGQKQASEVCSSEEFQQKQARTRTCTAPCVDQTTCSMREEQEVDVIGTKECPAVTDAVADDTEDAAEISAAAADETCATACQPWEAWSDWSPPPASCDLTARKSSGSYTQQRSRNRTCTTTNLRAGEKCPTTNSEKMQVPCPFCAGEGQVLAADGTCACDGLQGYYEENENATSCTKCAAPKLIKKVSDVWECTEPDCDCDDKGICGEWSDWQVKTGSQDVREVCKGEKFAQTLEQTRSCTAVNCVGVDKCKQRDAKTIEAVGTKETNCDTTCDGWGVWSEWLPATAPENCVAKFTQTSSRTRNCAQACASARCEEKEEQTQQVDCYAAVSTRIEAVPPCNCDTDCQEWTWTLASDGQTSDKICKGLEFEQKQTGTRECPAHCPEECKTGSQTKKLTGTKETPCADNCATWNDWSVWSPTVSSTCPADTSFEPYTFEQTRNRERECQGICSYLKCPTSNSETIQTSCPYCQGEGQLKLAQPDAAGRTCVCDNDASYYRQAGEDNCTKCPSNLTYDADDKRWECAPVSTTALPAANNCPQKYYHSSEQDTDGNCQCDYSRKYIPNRGRFGAANEGQLLGGCVCDNNHEEIEVAENGEKIKKCRECESKTDLRRTNVAKNKWECVTCTLQDLLRDSKLAHEGYIGQQRMIGFECHCAKFGGHHDKHVYNKSNVIALALHPPSGIAPSDATYQALEFRNWYSMLAAWHNSDQAPGAVSRTDPPDDEHYYAAFGTDESKVWHYSLWLWYTNAYHLAKQRGDDDLYPPIPAAWQDHYSAVRAATTGSSGSPATLQKHSELRYISCTLMSLIEQ